jgi:TetR/AcrR family transcriptional repressor of nem operon
MAANPGRPLEFDPDAALEAAMGVFWRQGYENTSMQDLLTAMNISKSSLYQAFGSKRRLFDFSMQRYQDGFTHYLREHLQAAPSGRGFIAGFLNSVLDEVRAPGGSRGCLVMNTAIEFAQRDPAVSDAVNQGIDRFRGVLQAAVERAQREGEIGQDRDPAILASFLVSSMSGLKTLAKAGADEKVLKGIIELVLKALD